MTSTRSQSALARTSSPRGPLFGMYALLTAALACVGASSGNLFFDGDRSLVVPFADAVNRCALRFPVTGFLSVHVQEFNQCRQAAYRTEGWFVVGAAAVVPLAAAGLVFLVPWLDRWRLARAGRWPDVPGAKARFGRLCDQTGLTGRLRPGLQVAGLALRQAFTTALPGGRPLVVIPVGTALAHRDPERFDPVLLHELAHVRARDVSWVSTVRGLALITVPALVLASVPAIIEGGSLLAQRTFLIQAGAFVACSLLLAAALLRRREIDADRQAVRWLGSPDTLRQVLDPGNALTRPSTGRSLPALLARHPSLTTRITALRDPLGLDDSGFAYALAAGAITAMVMNTSYFIATIFDTSLADQVPMRASAGAGGLMLGLTLTPPLLRRAARARDAGTSARPWQPAAGTALGLFLGSLIPPGTAFGAAISFFLGQGTQGIAVAGILACIGAGVVTLIAGLAWLATAPAGRVPMWVTASTTVVMSCCAAAALLPIPGFNFSQIERLYLAFVLPNDQWRWLAVLYPVAVVAMKARTLPRRRLIRALPASLVTPLLAATVTAVLFFPHDHAGAIASPAAAARFGEEQWWAAVLAGLAVLIVLSLARGIPGLASACVTAWLTTLLVGVERAIYGSITGGWHYFRLLVASLATPSVWLFYLGVLAACLALAGFHTSTAPKRRWTTPAVACAGAGAAAIAVFATGVPGLLVPLTTVSDLHVPGSNLVHPVSLAGAPTPRDVLSDTSERTIIARVGQALPDNWTSNIVQPSSAPAGHTVISPSACAPFVNAEYLKVLPRPVSHMEGQFKILPGFIDGTETLNVVVESFAQPVPAALFTAADRDTNACHRYKISSSAGTVTAKLRGAPVNGLSVPAWRAEVSISTWAASTAITWLEIGIGHNLVILNQASNFTGALAQPNQAAIDAAVRAVTPASAPLPSAALQVLTQAAARHIAGAVGPHLGSSWAPGSLPAATRALVTYQPADCAALAHEVYLNALPRPLARAEDRYTFAPRLANDGLENLSVRVESFAHPVSDSLLTAASRIFRACPHYTTETSESAVAASDGPSYVTTHSAFVPGLGFPTWRGDISMDLDPGSASSTWIMIAAGHNFILISQQTISNGTGSQPDEKILVDALADTIVALAHSR
jgi:Zn-dependent protease with chaperone function